ncbi:MAG TPA: C39 family peptidase [Nocardioidaceae bacterium]|nr:C39 family peptidase [Nocardioidaceae bacterium]
MTCRTTRRGAVVAAATSLLLAATGTLAGSPAVAKDTPPAPHHVRFTEWDFSDGDPGGTYTGTTDTAGALRLADAGTSTRDYDDPHDDVDLTTAYDVGSWVSPDVRPGFGLTELVASWNADTPDGTWVEVAVQGLADTGATSKWYVLGRWSEDDTGFHPTSAGSQSDDLARVAIDTLVTGADRSLVSYHVKVSLLREVGTSVSPTVDMVGAMASRIPELKKIPASPTTMTRDVVLDVPTYSQEVHLGDYPQWDGGGEAWCSPTSTSMVVGYWDRGPSEADLAWIPADHPDRQVDYAARYTYDYNYDGAGNWPFNTAYAARFGLEAFVTRLRSLAEAEQMIKAGIPVVVSASFKESKLDGAGYGTNGHLLTIVGFEKDGDVVVNDPASHLIPSDDEVRVTYDRAQFENAWIGHTGGISYLIHPESVPLPDAPAEANW